MADESCQYCFAKVSGSCPDCVYECAICGRSDVPYDEGTDDAIDRVLGGVCDACWAALPRHVIEWGERVDGDSDET